MKLRTTLILLALVVGLGLFFLLHTARQPSTTEYKEQQKRVFPTREFQDPADPTRSGLSDLVTRIELRQGENKIVLVREEKDEWRITEPIATAADAGQVSSILSELEFLKAETVLRPEEGADLDLESYGLTNPDSSVTFQAGDRSWTLDIGDNTVDGKSVYVARADVSQAAYVAPKSVIGKASKDVSQLRDKSPIRFDKSEATGLDIGVADKPAIACRKEKGRWRLTRPVEDEADSDVVKKLLDNIASLRIAADDFITEDESRLGEFGLDEPRMTISVFEGDAGRTLLVGQEAEDRAGKLYAKRQGESSIFALKKDALDGLQKTPSDLRARNALQFSTDDVTSIEIALAEGTVRLVKAEAEWEMEKPEGFSADKSQVTNFLNDLSDLQIKKWLDDPTEETIAEAAVAEPQAEVTLTLKEDQPGHTLRFGNRAEEPGLCHARRGDKGPILLVPSKMRSAVLSGHLAFLPRKMLEFTRNDAVAVRIERPEVSFSLTKEDDAWKTLEPVEAQADSYAVDDLLWTLCWLEAKRILAEKAENLEEFGLDKPRIRAVVTLSPAEPDEDQQEGEAAKEKAPERKVLLVGKAEEDGAACAMVEGGDYVFLVGKSVLDRLGAEFVSRDVCSFEKDAVIAVEALGPDGSPAFRYEKSEDQWRMTRPAEEAAKQEEVDEVLEELRALRAESIAEYNKEKADLKDYGLDKPDLVIRIEAAEAENVELSIGKKEEDVRYAVSSSTPCVFRIKEDGLSTIIKRASPETKEEKKSD